MHASGGKDAKFAGSAFSALAFGLALPSVVFASDFAPPSVSDATAMSAVLPAARRPATADFAGEMASADARRVADWVVGSGDNHRLPFAIVDKIDFRIFLFDATGTLLGTAPVLLGLAWGDDSPLGIGNRPLSQIAPAERITPAGRFVAGIGLNLAGQDILWVDYAAAISVHRATDTKAGLTANGRLARLASATTLDNRISHGCINVSADFFEGSIRPAFAGTRGIVYVMPETRSILDEFPIPTGAMASSEL